MSTEKNKDNWQMRVSKSFFFKDFITIAIIAEKQSPSLFVLDSLSLLSQFSVIVFSEITAI